MPKSQNKKRNSKMHNNINGTDIKIRAIAFGVLNFDTLETKKRVLFAFYIFGVIIKLVK